MVVNPKPSLMQPDTWSPNQVAKRDQIVHAASRVMVMDGVHACTARSVSAACKLSTSAIHYYFKDTEEMSDLAFRRVMERFFVHIEHEAAAHTDPVDSLWASANAYFERTSDSIRAADDSGHRHAPMLWFEFQAQSLRTGDLTTVRELSERGSAFFVDLISRCSVDRPEIMAEALYCSLLGAAVRNSMVRRPTTEWVADLLSALSLPMPIKAAVVKTKGGSRKAVSG